MFGPAIKRLGMRDKCENSSPAKALNVSESRANELGSKNKTKAAKSAASGSFGEGGSASPKTMLEPARPRAADQRPP